MLKTSANKYAFIETKDNLRYNLHVYNIKTYTTPITKESTFDFNFIAIAMKIGFKYEHQFKRMQVKDISLKFND